MEKPTQVDFCVTANLERHRAFFRSQIANEVGQESSTPPRAGEQWKVMAKWDAAHQAPLRYDDQKINPPELVEWSPKGDRLFTSCDAFGLTVWDAGALSWDPNARKVGEDSYPAGYGHPVRLFISQRGGSIHVLQEVESTWEHYYLIRDGAARPICKAIVEPFWGWARMWGPSSGLNRNEGINPWRPGSESELGIVRDCSTLKLVDVTTLPDRPTVDRSSLIEFFHWITGRASTSGPPGKIPAHEAPAKQWIAFDSLGSRDKTIFGFHFHPSGEYVAVTTGDPDDELWRRIHIVHIDSASIVASVPATSEGLGWSPDGRFLLCRRTTALGGKGNAQAALWDSVKFDENPDPPDELLSQPWSLKALVSDSETILSADGQRALISSGTVVASVLREGLRVRPGEHLTKLTAEPFAHAAWHPSDPHCFATVGGEASKEYPDTYRQGHRTPHGRLLRIWRMVN